MANELKILKFQEGITVNAPDLTALLEAALKLRALASQTDNVDISGHSVLRVGGASPVTFNGLTAGETNQLLFIINEITSGDVLTIAHNSGSGTQKFLNVGSKDLVLKQYSGASYIYNGTNWVLTGGSGGSSDSTAAITSIAVGDSPYTVLSTDHVILANAASGNITVNLPAASGNDNRTYIIKKTDSSTNTVTIDGNGSETIDGATTHIIYDQYTAIMVVCDGTNWQII